MLHQRRLHTKRFAVSFLDAAQDVLVRIERGRRAIWVHKVRRGELLLPVKQRSRLRAWLVGVALLGVGACSGPAGSGQSAPSTCTPGHQRNCECELGLIGVQVCSPDGSGYGACHSCASGGSGGSGGGVTVGGSGGGGTSGACTQPVDIVFVLDVSTGMGPFLNKLAGEIEAVDNAVALLNPSSPPHYGLVVFVDDTTLANSGVPYAGVQALKADIQTWATFTASNQQTSKGGQNTTYAENSLDALFRAATEFSWRPLGSTLRMVVHATDDTFWQGPTTQDGVQILHNYSEVTSALKVAEVRVVAFAAKLGGPLKTDDVSAGWFSPVQGAPTIPDATGGGAYALDAVLGGTILVPNVLSNRAKQARCKPYGP